MTKAELAATLNVNPADYTKAQLEEMLSRKQAEVYYVESKGMSMVAHTPRGRIEYAKATQHDLEYLFKLKYRYVKKS